MNSENGGRTILTNPWDSYAQNQKIRYPFTRQLMFAKVMEDPELCRIFLERLFEGRKVKDVVMHGVETVTAEATKIPGVFSKYVRLDVLFEDEASWNNIELQCISQEDLPQRGRYYSAVIDVTHLKPGDLYGDLKSSYVIFLCQFDYYGSGEAVYSFERFDRKKQLPCRDGSYIIILNTEAPEEKVPVGLQSLFRYISTQEVDAEDAFVTEIHKRVLKYQGDEEVAYNMTLEEEFLREKNRAARAGREAGLAEGREAGLAEGREAGLAEGREAGLVEGAEKERIRLNQLNKLLRDAGRNEELFRSMDDPAYQQQLLEEYGLLNV